MSKKLIVGGIDTDIGKTLASAIIVKMLKASYWKPISCSKNSQKDSFVIKKLVNSSFLKCYSESYHFPYSLSPHQAAQIEKTVPKEGNIILPRCDTLVIEAVGGIMTPFNNSLLTLEVFSKWEFPWVIVSKNYLGSINHTLLTIEVLKQKKRKILGIIFNGDENKSSEKFITRYTSLPVIGRINFEKNINDKTITRYSKIWKKHPIWKKIIAQ